MKLSRSEVYALMKMVEAAIEDNKHNRRPLEECQKNPAVNLLNVLYVLQQEYIERIQSRVSHRV